MVAGGGRLIVDFEMMLGRKLSVFWYCTWMVITPLILVVSERARGGTENQ